MTKKIRKNILNKNKIKILALTNLIKNLSGVHCVVEYCYRLFAPWYNEE